MAERKPTPEEQLLKLIENPEADAKGEGGSARAGTKTAKKSGVGFGGLGKLRGALDYARAGFKKKTGAAGPRPPLALKKFNHVLLALVLASGIYLVMDLMVLRSKEPHFLAEVSTGDAVYPVTEELGKGAPRELSYYKEAAMRRNPFLPPAQPQVPGAPAADMAVPAPPSSKLAELLQGLKLVGISWGAEPLAMIEDAATGRTYFLKRGQEMKGVKVQAISKEKVTVTYEGEEGELF